MKRNAYNLTAVDWEYCDHLMAELSQMKDKALGTFIVSSNHEELMSFLKK